MFRYLFTVKLRESQHKYIRCEFSNFSFLSCRLRCFSIFSFTVYLVARKLCGSFILRIGDFLWFAGTLKFLRYMMTEISEGTSVLFDSLPKHIEAAPHLILNF